MRISDWSSDMCSSDLVIRSQAACDRAAFAAARTRVTPSATLVFLNSNDFPRCHRKAGPGPQEPHPPRRRARGMDSVAAEQAIERQPLDLPEGHRRHVEQEEDRKSTRLNSSH